MKSYLLLFFSLFLFVSCGNDDANLKFETEADITAYIAAKNLNAQRTNSGLYYVIDKEGTGNRPNSNSVVKVSYKGYFLNGNTFDQNSNGISIGLNQVIRGWTEGIQLFKEGGEGILIVPYQLGYGAAGRGSIPGGATLVFDIKLINVN